MTQKSTNFGTFSDKYTNNKGVVLEVLQVVGSKFLFHKTCRYLPLHRKKLLMTDIFNFLNFGKKKKKKKRRRKTKYRSFQN